MELVDLNKPGEKKKLVYAGVLGLAAILVLWWVFFGFGSSTPTNRPQPAPSPQRAGQTTPPRQNAQTASPDAQAAQAFTEPLDYVTSAYNPPEAQRNIFSYWEPPPKQVVAVVTPTPSPSPPPPILVAAVNPSNVYARTADFKLDLAGDKFTPAVRIYVDGRELPTAYKSPQEVSATMPASFITNPGTRTVSVRTPDNKLYSNDVTINVAAPPTPNFTYIGIISPTNRVDTALVQDRSNKNVLSAYKGDVIGGRFRVTSISEKELVLVDTSLKIKHSLPMTEGDKTPGALSRPTPRVDSEDDEP